MADKDSEQVEEITLEDVARQLARLRQLMSSSVGVCDFGTKSMIPFRIVSLRELLLHRFADLSDAAFELYSNGRAAGAIILTRAVIETVSMMFVLRGLIADATRPGDIDEVKKKVMKMLFGSRTGMTPEQATNIMTHIDKADSKFDGLRWWYDQLSEISHPNYAGLFGIYAHLDQTNLILHLGAGEGARKRQAHLGLPALSGSVEVGIHLYNSMVEPLRAFLEICPSRDQEEGGG
jgi:hypothetical protein